MWAFSGLANWKVQCNDDYDLIGSTDDSLWRPSPSARHVLHPTSGSLERAGLRLASRCQDLEAVQLSVPLEAEAEDSYNLAEASPRGSQPLTHAIATLAEADPPAANF